ncbi:MAG: tRNA preQ1(34) S-adenosylmethionine ribosyltransferase-isomerase QueA [Betaproteobacteria bacterium]|jgi:S-adenosylmethionine:tRNA ribosyltransferase-isomerase
MNLDDFDYFLPPHLIATEPPSERGESRLLRVQGAGHAMEDALFGDLPNMLAPADLLVFNNTRVIRARLRGVKESGGRVEVLVERVLSQDMALALVRASHSPRAGAILHLGEGLEVEVIGREGEFFRLRFLGGPSVYEALDLHGEVPLPPYMGRQPEARDDARYQTVYASRPGAVAAPTAGLHFTESMRDRLRAMGVKQCELTLHVGAGTFNPVRVNDLARHRMHREWYEVPQAVVDAVNETRLAGGRVVAVGTTSVRALEASATASGAVTSIAAETDLFIQPGYQFRVVDALITNFHLPKSTLLMLVSAFAGTEVIRQAYAHAIAAEYRFFSYGDAMLLKRAGGPT